MPRYHVLDGLRGLAALSVFFSHCAYTLPDDLFAIAFGTPLRLLLDGKAAVDLFFVLSGFVLALPYMTSYPQRWSAFIIRRVFRIYPAHLAALILAASIAPFVLVESLNHWGAAYPEIHSSLASLLWQATLLGTREQMTGVNPVIWTLAVEVQMALIFPFVGRIAACGPAVQTGLFISSLIVGIVYWPLPLFVFGALIARHRPVIKWAPIIGVALYGVRAFVPSLPGEYTGHIICGAGAAILIATGSNGGLRLLSHSIPQFLGRISFSLYLTHFPILLTMTSRLSGCSMILAWSVAFALTLPLSWLLWRYVEMPGQTLGRRLTSFHHNMRTAAKPI